MMEGATYLYFSIFADFDTFQNTEFCEKPKFENTEELIFKIAIIQASSSREQWKYFWLVFPKLEINVKETFLKMIKKRSFILEIT